MYKQNSYLPILPILEFKVYYIRLGIFAPNYGKIRCFGHGWLGYLLQKPI